MDKPKCSECGHMEGEFFKCGRNIFYCKITSTECLPHRIIARSRETEIPMKTAPKWCPLRLAASQEGGNMNAVHG